MKTWNLSITLNYSDISKAQDIYTYKTIYMFLNFKDEYRWQWLQIKKPNY